ncbi:EXS-domain-containing protein [Myriangium duriaei CBS 260.36]|uniref:EXS-domain-containing protein n=1 Tax=Myriangium duriaei CBS 260.36 TaxID=1168546 RepID=A0A9P4J2B0_9PEZI|nr:EXS-domain-containing protein [Myriangium duriaei CBS 260.36]
MKFAKEFERELVPEWRAKYLNYKQGKKKLKAVGRALRNASKPPSSFKPAINSDRDNLRTPVLNLLKRRDEQDGDHIGEQNGHVPDEVPATPSKSPRSSEAAMTEHSPLAQGSKQARAQAGGMTRYGSIIGSPPDADNHLEQTTSNFAPSLRLPGPAMTEQENVTSPMSTGRRMSERSGRSTSISSLPPGVSLVNPQQKPPTNVAEHRLSSIFHPPRSISAPGRRGDQAKRPFLKRVLSLRPSHTVAFASPETMPMEAYKDYEARKDEFFEFLDNELKKIDDFYKEKEEQATERLKVLRDQLHIMRDRRMDEVTRVDQENHQSHQSEQYHNQETNGNGKAKEPKHSNGTGSDAAWLNSLDKAVDKARLGHVGKTFKAMKDLGTPSGPSAIDMYKDYTRKPFSSEIPYRTAKHKLKVALAEYYRGLELLKSYSLLNRTAFRKIVKKYDKTVNAQPTGQYMTEKVSKAYFVNSEVIEGHIHAVEDLYSRYFERGNRKVAVGKLRAKVVHAGEFSRASFINGILLALGTAFMVEGLVYASDLLSSPNRALTLQTTYLLQIYGGFLLTTLLALFFCLACRIWHRSKVNYTFVFEFDTRRQVLDWRQLSEIPSVLYFLVGVFVWLNFRQVGGETLFLWWPVILTVLILMVLLNPIPVLYPKSRQWFAYSLWRLFFAGIYPVEFRDFFLGDLFCSETYAMGNIELFFCLYAQHPLWSNPPQCSSINSRLLGFLTCLPGIWRALQCIRRYKDTKNVFPHLVNCGKYFCTVMQYMTLSLYRVDFGTSTKALFIVFGVVNGIYCSVWDLAMDWSLLDPYAKHRFLRKTLAFKSTWPYYVAMVVDPIIRFNFLLYVFYAENPKHSALVSFFVAFTEVCRRGMWMMFRVENEHCANVGRFRAYRDAPLPYETAPPSPKTPEARTSVDSHGRDHTTSPEQAANLEAGRSSPATVRRYGATPPSGAMSGRDFREQTARMVQENAELRRRRGQATNDSPVARALVRAGTMIHFAHTQDFERKRKPDGDADRHDTGRDGSNDDDTDEDNSDSDMDAAELTRSHGTRNMSPRKNR